jgi:hypothetical protein
MGGSSTPLSSSPNGLSFLHDERRLPGFLSKTKPVDK